MSKEAGTIIVMLGLAAIATYLEVNGQSGGFVWWGVAICFIALMDL